MKFISDLEDYPEDFLPGDIVTWDEDYSIVLSTEGGVVHTDPEVDYEGDVDVTRYTALVNPLEDALALHRYFLAEEARLEALSALPRLTQVQGIEIAEVDTRFKFERLGDDYIVEEVNLDEGTIYCSTPGDEIWSKEFNIPETAFVLSDDLTWITR